MKRITLTLIALAASTALAQDPPTPPAAPRAPRPATPPTPMIYPGTRIYSPSGELTEIRELSRLEAERAREMARHEAEIAREAARFDTEHAREIARAAAEIAREASRIDVEQAREMARASAEIAREASRIDSDRFREEARMAAEMARTYVTPMPMPMPAMAPMPPMAPMPAMAPMPGMYFGDRIDNRTPPAPWAKGDPADSLYKLARDLLNKGDYGRAARMFADIQKNYSKSAYSADAQYWEAWARYKIGTTDELRTASRLLEPLASKATPSNGDRGFYYSEGRRTSDNDILSLYQRVNGALALRGDRDAAAKVERAASTPGAPCDQEDLTVRTEALNALSQIDPSAALPILKRVIERKDECSASLRRSAVFMLGRRGDPESAALLMSVAKGDPSVNVRTEAVNFLSRIPGDAGLNALEDMLRNEQDERIQRAAVRALMASDNQRARSSMRALIDRKDAPMNLRVEAVNSFNSERATNDDANYLRNLFNKAETDQLKNAIVNAVSRIGGSDNDQWVMNVARNNNESSSVRSNAISRFTRSNTVSTADLAKMYDAAAESFDIRRQIVSILGNRRDTEATDKLIDIVRNGTVVSLRTQAINALLNKKDPRATKLLEDILDGKKP